MRVHFFAGSWDVATGGEKFNRALFAGIEDIGTKLTVTDCYKQQAETINQWLPKLRFLLRAAWVRGLLIEFALAARLPRKANVVVVAYQDYQPFVFFQVALRLARRLCGFKVMVIVHHMDDYQSDLPEPLRSWRAFRANLLLGAADEILTISEFCRLELHSLHRSADHIHVIPPGVEHFLTTSRHRQKGPSQLLCVAHIVKRKGILDLIEAFAQLKETNVRLLLVGSTEREPGYAASVRSRIDERGLGDRVSLVGRLSDPELQEAYASSVGFAFPSHFEGFGMAIVEAMSAGLPVVAYRVSAIPELIRHNENGWLTEFRDIAGLSEGLRLVVEDAAWCKAASEAARKSVAGKYQWGDIRQRFQKLLARLAEGDYNSNLLNSNAFR